MPERITKSLVKKTNIVPFKAKGTFKKIKRFLTKKNVKRALLYGGGGLLVFIILLFAWFARDLPNPNKINARTIAQSTKIYDRSGQLLYEIHGDKRRTLIDFKDMPDNIKKATIAVEDKNFYNHGAFDYTGLIRAFFYNLFHKEKTQQGGSTITQQFVKNALLSPEQTWTRKIKEAILSIEMEWMFSKDDILKMYLNEIPFGSNAYGVQAAAQTYFNKDAKTLDLAECAMLAALPKAPSYYSPYGTHTDELWTRQHYVLDRMAEEGYISKEEAEKAKTEKLAIAEPHEAITAPHFVLYVKEKLIEQYGEQMVEEGGLKVTTTLDLNKQKIAEEVVRDYGEKNVGEFGATNAALVSIDPETGQILAMVGSRDYFNKNIDGNVNVADRDRQPGSSLKPYIYATGFKMGYTPDTTLFDLNTNFGGGYEPKDYDMGQRGPVTVRKALAGSLNIPAVKMLYLVGVENAIATAHDLGITTLNDPSKVGLSMVLGGGEVKLVDHTAAMSTIASEGIRHEKTPIIKVEDSRGKVLDEYKNSPKEVMDINVTKAITDIMSDNSARAYVFGTNNPLVLSRPAAAKTGTTDEFRDAWTVGFTPNLAAGVWVGNNDNTPMRRGSDGIYAAAPLWHDYMEKALEGMPVKEFNKDYTLKGKSSNKPVINGKFGDPQKERICNVSGKKANNLCPSDVVSEKEVREAHTILYYVDKANPLGPIPSNPQADPQFNGWEGPIRGWAEKNGYLSSAPNETCNVHTEANKPSITLNTPTNGATVGNTFTATVSVNAPTGISRIEVFADGVKVGTGYGNSIDCTASAGVHVITAKITDNVSFTATSSGASVTILSLTPSGLTASSLGGGQIQLNWGGAGDATGFEIQRNGATIATVGGAPYTDGGLTPGTSYSYKVRGKNGSNYGNWSAPASAVAFNDLKSYVLAMIFSTL